MPIIVVLSPKGGSGKTTISWALSTQLAKNIDEVSVLDADPNRPFADMVNAKKVPERMTVVTDVTENNIARCIREAALKTPFVLVDLEGTASKIAVVALQYAEFVIIPMKGSYNDAKAAGTAIALIEDQEGGQQMKTPSYRLPFAIAPTETGVLIETKIMRKLKKNLKKRGVPLFNVELNNREAYRAMIDEQSPLELLDPKKVSGLKNAIANAEAFTAEVLDRIDGKYLEGPEPSPMLEDEGGLSAEVIPTETATQVAAE